MISEIHLSMGVDRLTVCWVPERHGWGMVTPRVQSSGRMVEEHGEASRQEGQLRISETRKEVAPT